MGPSDAEKDRIIATQQRTISRTHRDLAELRDVLLDVHNTLDAVYAKPPSVSVALKRVKDQLSKMGMLPKD